LITSHLVLTSTNPTPSQVSPPLLFPDWLGYETVAAESIGSLAVFCMIDRLSCHSFQESFQLSTISFEHGLPFLAHHGSL